MIEKDVGQQNGHKQIRNKEVPMIASPTPAAALIIKNSLLVIFAIGNLWFNSLAQIPNKADSNPADLKTKEVHVAFAGGGWRAHAGHTAWITAGLNASDHKLERLFDKTKTFASNSGGSWFNTMLAYSGPFVDAIQAKNAIATWGIASKEATGWLGQQEYIFNQAPCHSAHGDLFALCVAAFYTGNPLRATHWHHIVEDVVFKDNQIQTNLSGTRQTWSDDKTLILASTLLTNEVVLGEHLLQPQYYQACRAPAEPTMSETDVSACSESDIITADVSPVAFTSLPKSSDLTALPFFSATEEPVSRPQFNLGYLPASSDAVEVIQTTISNPKRTDQISVIVAASASSAATGFAASHKVTDSWLASYAGSDEPITFALDGGLEHLISDKIDTQTLASKKVVQLADGGAADNSAVAHLVAFLQLNGKADEFNIVAFDNVQALYLPNNDESKRVGIDIANLFGQGLSKGNKICSGKNGKGYCVTAPNLQIFEIDALETTPVTWSSRAPSEADSSVVNEILYTKYSVKTVDNPNFGIKAGSTGTLHAFTAAWSNAATAPQNPRTARIDGDFEAYNDMFKYINASLNAESEGLRGIDHLMNSLGHN